MPLENLPDYLKSHNSGDGVLVDVGNIVVEPTRPYMKWAAVFTVVTLLGMGGIFYNTMSNKELTVMVDTKQPEVLSQMVTESGGEILAITQTNDSTYEVKVSTRKSRNSFLEWLRKKDIVNKAE